MSYQTRGARALFLAADGQIYPDVLICSGVLPEQLGGRPCFLAENGRLPTPIPLNQNSPDYHARKGQPGDLCPPCARESWGSLEQWQGGEAGLFGEGLRPLRLFKCQQNMWLVVPGLFEAAPDQILHIDTN
ncbi:MAG: hypothetical protein H6658_09295 [Ardenticatenaceae bacterium]|nr:hypothetical protein [Ardenticatenaceae bacterium]